MYIKLSVWFLVVFILIILLRKLKADKVDNFREEILFETAEYEMYRYLNIFCNVWISAVVIVTIAYLFLTGDYWNEFIYTRTIVYILPATFSYFNNFKKMIVTKRGLYYITRLARMELICKFENLHIYEISEDGRVKLFKKKKNGKLKKIRIMEPLEKIEIDKFKDTLNKNNIKYRNN
jgi:hypothetical protein